MENPLKDFSFTDPFSTWWPFIFAVLVGIVTTLRSFISGPECQNKTSMMGKTVVLTGGSHGIGLEVVIDLLNRGAQVIIGTRNKTTTKDVLKKLVETKRIKDNPQWMLKTLDLTSLNSVRKFAQSIDSQKVDVLINNAGVAVEHFDKTVDGYEKHFQVNYLAHFLLTMLLLPKLKASTEGRVVITAACIQSQVRIDLKTLLDNHDYTPKAAFAKSKLALILMTRTLSSSWHGKNVTINAANPGLVRGTGHNSQTLVSKSFYFRLMIAPASWLFMKTARQAAQTIVYLAVAEELKGVSGRYFSNCSETKPQENAMDFEEGRSLIQKSLHLTGLADKH